MANFLQVQINIILSILIISLFFHAFFKMNIHTTTNRFFIWLMGSVWLALVLEIFSVMLNVPGAKQWILLNKLVNLAGFVIAHIVPYLGYMLCKAWAGRFQNNGNKKGTSPDELTKKSGTWTTLDYILLLPLIVNTIGSLMSLSGGQFFRITSENVYERGPLFFFLPVISFLYFIYCMMFIFIHHKQFTRAEMLLFSMLCIVPAFFTIVQLKYFTYLTTWNSAAFVVIIAYVFILNDQVYKDSLTGLENRLAFEHYSQRIKNKKRDRICMIYIDIDNFKLINDQFGHAEGDRAIRIFADLIVESFTLNRKRIIRFGGDEFLVMIDEPQQTKIDSCLEAFAKSIKEFNKNDKKPYSLDFSYGMGRLTDEYKDVNELLNHIDHKMYTNKQTKKDL